MFYDCNTTTRIDHTWEPRLRECTSPDLYNAESSMCEPYQQVDCGDRKEPKDPCKTIYICDLLLDKNDPLFSRVIPSAKSDVFITLTPMGICNK